MKKNSIFETHIIFLLAGKKVL